MDLIDREAFLHASSFYSAFQEIQAYAVELARKKITEYSTDDKPCSSAPGSSSLYFRCDLKAYIILALLCLLSF